MSTDAVVLSHPPFSGPRPHAKSFRSNALWTLVGNAGYALAQWAFVMAIAKLGSQAEVGRFALALALSVPIFSLSNLQLRAIQSMDADRRFSDGDYLGLRLVLSGLGFVLILAITLASDAEAWIVTLVGLGKALEAVSDMMYGQWQREDRMKDIARSQLLKAAASLGLLTLGMWQWGIVGAVAGYALGMLLTLLAFDWPLARRLHVATTGWPLRARFDRPFLQRLFWHALPLGVVSLLFAANINGLYYLLNEHLTARDVGLYAAILYCFTFGDILSSAIGTPAGPRLARLHVAGHYGAYRRFLWQVTAGALGIGAAAALALLVGGDWLISRTYTPEYAGHTTLLMWLALNAALGYGAGILGCSMTAAGVFRAQTVIFVGVAVTGLGLGMILIPLFGLQGAAWALLGSTCVWFGGMLYCNLRLLARLKASAGRPVHPAGGPAGAVA